MAKLQYTKPSFQVHLIPLETTATGGCRYMNTSTESGTCGIDVGGGMTIFSDESTACNYKASKDKVCLDIPTNNGNIFNS